MNLRDLGKNPDKELLQKRFERQIRWTLKRLKSMARQARSDARYEIRRKPSDFRKAADLDAMAVAYDAAASVLVQDYAFLKVRSRK